MDINLNFYLNYAANSLNENIFCYLTEKQQKVAVVAALVFGCIAICYVVCHYCFKVELLQQEDKDKQSTQDVVKKEKDVVVDKKDVDGKQALEETAEKVDAVIKGEIQNADASEKSKGREKKEDAKKSEVIEVDKVKESFDIETEKMELKSEKLSEQEEISDYELPALLSFGKVRKGRGGGEVPIGGRETIIDNDKLYSALFAACFHTTESHQEILTFLREICIKQDELAKIREPLEHYSDSYHKLYNNLEHLHDALLGEHSAKAIKIYWSERAEELLLPYLFKHENVKIDDLLFVITPGEECQSSFQHPDINFEIQLQFVGFEEKKIMEAMKKEIKMLSQSIVNEEFGEEIVEPLDSIESNLLKEAGCLTNNAFMYKLMQEIIFSLRKIETSIMEARSKGLPEMSLEERTEMCQRKLEEDIDNVFVSYE